MNLPAGPHVELGRARFLRRPGRQAQQGGGQQRGPQPPAAPPAGRRHLGKEALATAAGRAGSTRAAGARAAILDVGKEPGRVNPWGTAVGTGDAGIWDKGTRRQQPVALGLCHGSAVCWVPQGMWGSHGTFGGPHAAAGYVQNPSIPSHPALLGCAWHPMPQISQERKEIRSRIWGGAGGRFIFCLVTEV